MGLEFQFEFQKETSTKTFNLILFNNMDHMRISGTEPSSVILSQTQSFIKVKSDAKKCQNKVKQKGMVKKNPTKLQFQ